VSKKPLDKITFDRVAHSSEEAKYERAGKMIYATTIHERCNP
jgi:hypothetical protein